ncbi:MAG: tRNA lysidine(34) synthetase TilS [Candidatus Poribacteria bacterium]|nr:tRNA lysidine(34) synthetase TilS [Candidatus Poribacteria bacterium]
MKADFVRQMHRFILRHAMIENGETVIVAVSGGADSLALLYGLHALRTQLNCQLHVAHLNHCLRSDADADADFVQQHATNLELPCTIGRADVPLLMKQWKLSVEASARRARYQFYEDICTQIRATKVALGHHRDDTAETVLMNLIRGSGTTGLKGIAPVRDVKFIRPLADFTRQQIEAFLTSMGLVQRQDSTNTDTRYLRNRIRHELIPLLERDYNPNIKTGLSRTADVLGTESEYLDTVAREAFEVCRIQDSTEIETSIKSGSVVLDSAKLRQYHIAVQRRVLRRSFAEMSGYTGDLYFTHCEAMLSIVEGESPNTVLALPNGLRFRRVYQYLIFEANAGSRSPVPAEMENFAYPLAVPGKVSITPLKAEITVELGNIQSREAPTLPDGKFEAVFDYEKLKEMFANPSLDTLPLTVRNRRQGDRFRPYGMQGTKKLKDFLMDAKVPRYERDSVPLLVCGDEMLWIVGYTTSERFKIHPGTQQYLYLRYVSNETSP